MCVKPAVDTFPIPDVWLPRYCINRGSFKMTSKRGFHTEWISLKFPQSEWTIANNDAQVHDEPVARPANLLPPLGLNRTKDQSGFRSAHQIRLLWSGQAQEDALCQGGGFAECQRYCFEAENMFHKENLCFTFKASAWFIKKIKWDCFNLIYSIFCSLAFSSHIAN